MLCKHTKPQCIDIKEENEAFFRFRMGHFRDRVPFSTAIWPKQLKNHWIFCFHFLTWFSLFLRSWCTGPFSATWPATIFSKAPCCREWKTEKLIRTLKKKLPWKFSSTRCTLLTPFDFLILYLARARARARRRSGPQPSVRRRALGPPLQPLSKRTFWGLFGRPFGPFVKN